MPDNNSYDGWWGHDTLPKLNYEGSKELEEYILSIGRKWVSAPYNVDGWRLDVAADLGYSPEYNHYSGRDSGKRLRRLILMLLFLQNIMAIHMNGCRVINGIPS